METPAQFIEQARGILTQQNELENLAQILHSQIEQLEKENRRLVCQNIFCSFEHCAYDLNYYIPKVSPLFFYLLQRVKCVFHSLKKGLDKNYFCFEWRKFGSPLAIDGN